VKARMQEIVARLRREIHGVRIIGATVTSALGSSNASHGSHEEDASRQALNSFIRNSGLFDGVVDFDAATLDPKTGGLRAEFVPDSTSGGPGDKLHPNRAGYQAMGQAVPLALIVPPPPK
jgi:lysophospholipase L1-like esterase